MISKFFFANARVMMKGEDDRTNGSFKNPGSLNGFLGIDRISLAMTLITCRSDLASK
jgi:hypothetical protein